MAVLNYLAYRPGTVVSRQELEETVWAGTVVGYDALSNTIIKLRKAFGDKARKPLIIETITKSGYRLIAEVNTLAWESGIQHTGRPGESAHQRLPRKLAAILYADVVDYTRLTQQDEDATHQALSEYLDLFATRVEAHSGRVMHYAGDAVLAMFNAAIDAVSCACDVQQDVAANNAKIPDERNLWFRIGVNSGDVFEDRGDVYGNGVNIAARLEGLAQAGGICVSEAIHTAIGSGLEFKFQFIGEHRVKNIDQPVRVYTVESHTGDTIITLGGVQNPAPPDKPSIAVLPFDNMSGDEEQEYFSDGISEDITTDLSKLSGLLVIARNSAFAYKGKTVNVADIGRELGVRYLLEGSVRKSGLRVRINAQLIDVTTGGHVWAERYDRELNDIFAVQDEVAQAIIAAIAPTLSGSEQITLGQRETSNIEAYDYFLRGREQALLDSEESTRQAKTLLKKAIELDPSFSSAYSHLARCYALDYINNWGDPSQRSMNMAHELGLKAVALDPNNPHAHFTTGTAALWLKMHDQALQEINTALSIDPNFAEGFGALSMIQIYSGDPAKALESLQTTMRLDPHYRDIYLHLLAQAYFHLEQYAKAIEALKRRLIRKPGSDISHVLSAACYGHLGKFEQGREEWKQALAINPDYSLEQKRQKLPYQNPADFDHFADGLRKAGLVKSKK